MNIIAKNFSRLQRVLGDSFQNVMHPSAIPVVYFTGRPNVGDLLNEYLLPKISGRAIMKVQGNVFSHLRAVGSVLGSASKKSYVWGSGSIDGKRPNGTLSSKKVFALRGSLTRDMLIASGLKLAELPLGDPALLMPKYYRPTVPKKFRVGLIPHFSDEALVAGFTSAESDDFHVIPVGQQPEAFVADLLACDYVLSSSLHGLILSDAYGIPNQWVKFSDKLLGGNFKFLDYYSVTSAPQQLPQRVDSRASLLSAIDSLPSIATIKKYTGDLLALENSFPARYRRQGVHG